MRRRRYLDRRHSDNHERWLVSYADFVTLLFAFFVVMYAISSLNAGKYRVVSKSLLSAFRVAELRPPLSTPRVSGARKVGTIPAVPLAVAKARPKPVALTPLGHGRTDAVARQRRQRARAMRAVAREVLAALGAMARAGQVRITQSKRGVAVQINAKVLFAVGRARLQTASVHALARVGHVLAGVGYDIEVQGFTDNVPISTERFPSNWELSAARASSVARVFIASGVAAARLAVVGYGPNHPIASNSTAAGRARNRRVTVMILAPAPEQPVSIPLTGPIVRHPEKAP